MGKWVVGGLGLEEGILMVGVMVGRVVAFDVDARWSRLRDECRTLDVDLLCSDDRRLKT
jgi:hypothetical protein